MSKFAPGDLVKRKWSSVVTKYMARESKFFGLGVVLKKLWSVDGIQYYSVYWNRISRAQNTSEMHLLTLEEAKEIENESEN